MIYKIIIFNLTNWFNWNCHFGNSHKIKQLRQAVKIKSVQCLFIWNMVREFKYQHNIGVMKIRFFGLIPLLLFFKKQYTSNGQDFGFFSLASLTFSWDLTGFKNRYGLSKNNTGLNRKLEPIDVQKNGFLLQIWPVLETSQVWWSYLSEKL